jgi:RNA polymerase sigma factor (TIGR02999 family)
MVAAMGGEGDAKTDKLFQLVYSELRAIASRQLQRERPGQMLQTTALVHEAFLKLSQAHGGRLAWESEEHFLRAASGAMRRILVDQARARRRIKRGGGKPVLPLDDAQVELAQLELPEFLPDLDEALRRLAEIDPTAAELVQLRFFGGLTNQQAAQNVGISARSADRIWQFARAWLYDSLRGDGAA